MHLLFFLLPELVFCSATAESVKLKHSFKKLDRVVFTENLEGLTEWPHSWPDGDISYRLNNFSGDLLEHWQTRAVTVALRCWQLRINKIKFRRERNPDAHVDININFDDLDHFDGKKGVLAHAFFPAQGDISGDCHINDEWDWVASVRRSTMGKPPLVPILIHEFGHSLGLRHDTKISSMGNQIMYPSFDLGKRMTWLGDRDIERIQSRYGQRRLSQRILDFFLARRIRGGDFD